MHGTFMFYRVMDLNGILLSPAVTFTADIYNPCKAIQKKQ